ncbi:MAG TPA: hypothetical protein VGF06_17470 [Terriglobales bacterium]
MDEFVERVVCVLHEQEVWLAQNRSEIVRKIEEGYAAAERGELLDPDEVRSKLNELKRDFSSLLPTTCHPERK